MDLRLGRDMENGSVRKIRIETEPGRWRIRRMNRNDWEQLIISIQSDSDSRIRDWHNYVEADADVEFDASLQNTCYVIEDERTAQLLGYVAASKHGSRHGYIGGYYIHSSLANCQVAIDLLQAAIDHLQGRNIMVDFRADDVASPLCEAAILSQFKEASWRVIRYVGVPAWEHLPCMANRDLFVCHAQMIRLEDVADFDRTISGYNRLSSLRRLLRHSNENWIPKSVHLVVTNRRGEIRGYGCVRPGLLRARIGPVYARDLETFLLLFRNLMGSSREARTNGVDAAVGTFNRQAMDVMRSIQGLEPLRTDENCLQAKRYYTKWQPHAALDQVYCLTNSVTQYI